MSAIKVGDLVMVVKPYECCGRAHGVGYIFTVKSIDVAWSWGCTNCGTDMSDGRLMASGDRPHWIKGSNRRGWIPVAWLKKIDPPAEVTREEQKHKAPVEHVLAVSK